MFVSVYKQYESEMPSFDITIQSTSNALTLFLPDQPLCYFTLSNAIRFYSSWESLWVGKG